MSLSRCFPPVLRLHRLKFLIPNLISAFLLVVHLGLFALLHKLSFLEPLCLLWALFGALMVLGTIRAFQTHDIQWMMLGGYAFAALCVLRMSDPAVSFTIGMICWFSCSMVITVSFMRNHLPHSPTSALCFAVWISLNFPPEGTLYKLLANVFMKVVI